MRKIIGLLALALVYFVLNHTSLLTPETNTAQAPLESVQDLTPAQATQPSANRPKQTKPNQHLRDANDDTDEENITQALTNAKAVNDHATKQPAANGLVSADKEINKTLKLIKQGGPFPHKQDATIFQNRERVLPKQPRGYYHEYTVRTPGTKTRGARRIVTGGTPPNEYYYTPDHYRTFHKLEAEYDLP